MRAIRFFLALPLVLWGCEEAPLITTTAPGPLNAPIAMAFIPGTNLAVVANANVNLIEEQGSLVAIDLDTREVLTDTEATLPSFAGRIAVDDDRKELYVTDRGNESLNVFTYSIPGEQGQAISFSMKEVYDPAKDTTNGIRTDEQPFDVNLIRGSVRGDVLMVTNGLSGTVSVIPSTDLTPVDLFPDDSKKKGFPLISAANFKDKKKNPPPGRGANRFIPTPDGRLRYVPSTQNNNLYVIDTFDQGVEAMLDLSAISVVAGARGMAIASDGTGYLAHRGISGVIVLDLQDISDDGNDFELRDTKLIDVITTGREPEGVVLSTDEARLFVSNHGENVVVVIDVPSRSIFRRIPISGRSPSEMYLDSARGVIYVLNFLSYNISVLSEVDGSEITTIQ